MRENGGKSGLEDSYMAYNVNGVWRGEKEWERAILNWLRSCSFFIFVYLNSNHLKNPLKDGQVVQYEIAKPFYLNYVKI